jgi:malonyl-CoA decarboxylase
LISDRACFAYVHPAMPNEPIIFVEVALVRGIASSIQRLLDPELPDLEPHQADTAIFYSITNAQRGLRGIRFGNLLIKQVAAKLRSEVPNLTTFSSLSPIPSFRCDYFDGAVEDGSAGGFFSAAESTRLAALTGATSPSRAIARALDTEGWEDDEALAEALRPGLLRAARHYLTCCQRRGRVACPVGHFHASNGAILARINWLGDNSAKGLRQSAGMMVNYVYDLDRFERYQDRYSATGELALGEAVEAL